MYLTAICFGEGQFSPRLGAVLERGESIDRLSLSRGNSIPLANYRIRNGLVVQLKNIGRTQVLVTSLSYWISKPRTACFCTSCYWLNTHTWYFAPGCSKGGPRVLAASASFGILLEMQNLGSHPRPTDSESAFKWVPMWSTCTLAFEMQWFKLLLLFLNIHL